MIDTEQFKTHTPHADLSNDDLVSFFMGAAVVKAHIEKQIDPEWTGDPEDYEPLFRDSLAELERRLAAVERYQEALSHYAKNCPDCRGSGQIAFTDENGACFAPAPCSTCQIAREALGRENPGNR